MSHRYGHEKIENLSAAIEGILILVGSAAIAFAAIRAIWRSHIELQFVGLGIAVAGVSVVVNIVVSTIIGRKARRTRLARARPATPPICARTR